MNIQTTKEHITGKVTLIMTPEQEDIWRFESELREKIVDTLAEQYIKDFGDKILESITPDIISDEIKKHVSNKFWEGKR